MFEAEYRQIDGSSTLNEISCEVVPAGRIVDGAAALITGAVVSAVVGAEAGKQIYSDGIKLTTFNESAAAIHWNVVPDGNPPCNVNTPPGNDERA